MERRKPILNLFMGGIQYNYMTGRATKKETVETLVSYNKYSNFDIIKVLKHWDKKRTTSSFIWNS